jgi:flagellar hook-associated protein 3 FlgL
MRISDLGISHAALRRLQLHMTSLEDARTVLGTGKRILRPSDDVAGTSRVLSLRTTMSANQQAQRNTDDGIMWVQLADTTLQDVVARLHRAKELAVAGGNATTATEGLADEVASLREDLLELANTKHLGRGLFAGFSADDAVDQVAGVWTYLGDQGVTRRRVGEDALVQVNVHADDVFGFTSGRDVFSVLDDLEAALNAGDNAAASALIDDIGDSLGHVLEGLAGLGGAGERLDAARSRLDGDLLTVRENLSSLEDADLAGAVVNLEMQQAAYEAALAALRSIDFASMASFLG